MKGTGEYGIICLPPLIKRPFIVYYMRLYAFYAFLR